MRRVAMRLVMEPDPSSSLAGSASSEEIDDVARLHVVVGVFQDADLPAAFGRDDLRVGAPRQFQALASDARLSVSSSASSARRASSTIRGRMPRSRSMSSRMQIDVKDGRRQRRVVQRLETFAHIADDLENDFPRGGGIEQWQDGPYKKEPTFNFSRR